MSHLFEVVVKDDATRAVLEAALWEQISDTVSGGSFNGALSDEASSCAYRLVEGRAADAERTAAGTRLEAITTYRADIETVRQAPAGQTVELRIGSEAIDQLRHLMHSISEDESFWDRSVAERMRTMACHDTLSLLIDQLEGAAEAVA